MYASRAPNNNRKIAAISYLVTITKASLLCGVEHQRDLRQHSSLSKGNTVFQNHSENDDAEGAVKGTRIKLLDITALSLLRDEGHLSRYNIRGAQGVQDCLHWCLPGFPDTWNEIMAAQL